MINCKIVVLRVSVAWFQIKGRIPALISGRNLFHFEAPFGSAPNRNCQGEYVFCSVSCCALTPPQKVFRSSPYGPDPQVSARPRTEGGWVQNPLLNARVATFAFKAFATMRVPLHTLSPPWRGHGPPATTATENLRSRWVSGRQDPLLGFCVNSYVFV